MKMTDKAIEIRNIALITMPPKVKQLYKSDKGFQSLLNALFQTEADN